MKDRYHWDYKGDHLQIIEIEPISSSHSKVKRVLYNNKEGKKNLLMYTPFIMDIPYTISERSYRNEAQVIKFIFSKDFKFYFDRAE